MTLCGFLKVCIRHPLCSTDIAQPTRSVIPQTCSGAACLPQRSRPFVGCPAPSLAGSRDVPAQAWGDIPAPASGLSSVGEVRLVPDMATLRRLPWHPAHGVVLASMLRQPPPPDHAGDTGAETARPDSTCQQLRAGRCRDNPLTHGLTLPREICCY